MPRTCLKKKSHHARTPPYPPSLCVGRKRVGTDGRKYVSKLSVNGNARWVLVALRKRSASTYPGLTHKMKGGYRQSRKGKDGVYRWYNVKQATKPVWLAKKAPGAVQKFADGTLRQSRRDRNGVLRWYRLNTQY